MKNVYIGWKEIAERLEVKERTAREWARSKGLPVKVRVDVIRMTEVAALEWLEQAEKPYPEYAEEKKRSAKRRPRVLQAA